MDGAPTEDLLDGLHAALYERAWRAVDRNRNTAHPAHIGLTSVVRAQHDDSHSGFKLLTYHYWFKSSYGSDQPVGFIQHLNNRNKISTIARYRMGSHSLAVETGRWGVLIDGKKYNLKTMHIADVLASGWD